MASMFDQKSSVPTPQDVAAALGQAAIGAAIKSNLPQRIITLIQDAPAYMEGTSFLVNVKNKADMEIIQTLLAIKLQY